MQLTLLDAKPFNTSGKVSPTSLDPAQPCNASKCQLPSCRCANTDIPGSLSIQDTPQIVMFSFDDAFRDIDYGTYYSPIFGGRKNPNGCQIGMTFFTSHQYTDYSLVEQANRVYGWEFADHSVTHREPTTWWEKATAEEWTHEIMDQKTILSNWGGVETDKIQGFRGPFLVTSETEIEVLHENKFLYEATMGTTTNYWPFTLDYKSPLCSSPATCPNNSYPGLWIVPNILYKQSGGVDCAMLDACTAPVTEDDWFNFLVENFNVHYNDNKSPFGLYSHVTWFLLSPVRASAMKRFLDKLANMKDVYIVTHTQMLDWVRNPTPLNKIQDFAPWKCTPLTPPRCNYTAPTCQKTYSENKSLKSCNSPCPPKYPDYGNPLGH